MEHLAVSLQEKDGVAVVYPLLKIQISVISSIKCILTIPKKGSQGGNFGSQMILTDTFLAQNQAAAHEYWTLNIDFGFKLKIS